MVTIPLLRWCWFVTYQDLQTQFGEDRCTQFRVIMVTDPQIHKQTHKNTHKQTNKQTNPQTGPITIHCTAKLSAQCKNTEHQYQSNVYVDLHNFIE